MIALVVKLRNVGDVVKLAVFQPLLRVAGGAVVMRPVVMLTAVVAGDFAAADAGPLFRPVVNEQRAVGDGAQVVVDVVLRAETPVVSAVAGELALAVDEEV